VTDHGAASLEGVGDACALVREQRRCERVADQLSVVRRGHVGEARGDADGLTGEVRHDDVGEGAEGGAGFGGGVGHVNSVHGAQRSCNLHARLLSAVAQARSHDGQPQSHPPGAVAAWPLARPVEPAARRRRAFESHLDPRCDRGVGSFHADEPQRRRSPRYTTRRARRRRR
jgi:hypothetical protein